MTKAGTPYCIKQLIFTADCGKKKQIMSNHRGYEISVNGQNLIYVYKGNQEPPKLSFSGTETLDITVKKGFVFSYQNLNNGDLEVEYRLADGQTLLTENQFLPEKSEVTVTVKNPDDYTVTGGAIQAGEYAGTVTVTDKTNISDFAVQSTKKG